MNYAESLNLDLDDDSAEKPNVKALQQLSVTLLGTGASGFFVPRNLSPMSNARAYNVFHLAAGAIGLGISRSKDERAASWFNLVFGLIDVYQAFAGAAGIFPAKLFKLRRADHVVHLVVGLRLVAKGFSGVTKTSYRGMAGGPMGD